MTARCSLSVALATFCAIHFAVGADDPDVFLQSRNFADFKWVWAIKQSRASALPKWDPLVGEAPVSPHQAIMAGREFLKSRLGIDAPNFINVVLYSIGDGAWAYTIHFDAKTSTEDEQVLLDVWILMDGKVVVPVKQSVK